MTLGVFVVTLSLAFGGVEPYLAALLPLQVLWLLLRPEVVRVSAPALVGVVAVEGAGWAALLGAGLPALVSLGLAEVRLRARVRQRECARAAAGGVTAPVPGADVPLRRGVVLGVVGAVVLAVGGLLVVTRGVWDGGDDRAASAAVGFLLIGLGLTVLFSAALGRYRAAGLRSAPVPVLRVLVRDDEAARTEVFAADDVAALRPLFTVSALPLDCDEEEGEDEDDDGEDDDDLLELLDDDEPGPLREAVLYGVPFDGAEVVIVSADEDLDEPPVVERSAGPVRPVSVRDGRRGEKPAEVELVPQPVLSWRPGWLDWLAALLLAQWGVWLSWAAFTDGGTPLWQQLIVGALGLFGAARVPVKVGWRITADRAGLWINGLFKVTHIPWDDFRSARHESLDLKLRWRGGESWAVAAPRWRWLERRRGLTHPYDRLAAELTALRTDPGLRPTGDCDERERGRVLWPVALLLAVGWVVALVAARVGL